MLYKNTKANIQPAYGDANFFDVVAGISNTVKHKV